jgi:hypothetical protein
MRAKDGKYYYTYKISCLLSDKPYYYYDKHVHVKLNNSYFGSGFKLKKIIKGLGKNNFEKEILSFYNSHEELCNAEREVIGDLYNTDKWCMNLREGGSNGRQSEETKAKYTQIRTGRKNSDETRRLMSLVAMGNKYSLGRIDSEKTIELKRSKAKERWEFEKFNGIKRQKPENPKLLTLPIVQFTLDGSFVAFYKSVKEAADEVGISAVHLNNCARGKKKVGGGYLWKTIAA